MSEGDLSIDLDQAQRIIEAHLPSEHRYAIANLIVLQNQGYSHTPDSKTYVVDLLKPGSTAAPTSSCFLTIARPSTNTGTYPQNTLPLVANLLTLIRTSTAIPIRESTLDTSLSLIPFHFLLSPPSPFPSTSIVSLPVARASGGLSEKAQLSIDLLLGAFLGQLHNGVQNDWYGFPMLDNTTTPPKDTGYSWQETFTGLLEGLLEHVETDEAAYGVSLPYVDIRRYLSRAIGSFLFDDVEVPSLVWFTGSEHDIYITLPSGTGMASAEPGTIAAILPNVAHALWGDPLLEAFMMGPPDRVGEGAGPSKAFMEGYVGGGGGPVLVFGRQKTKRIWYSVFLALVVLTKYGPAADGEEAWVQEKRKWAREALDTCVSALKEAPCY
ncbi:hypothetical protein D9615_005444 [Tricholomella constricta]|uniref:Uncharacterized protein n=1 Tax=Tricholomella constricta TaxID=117010 RepID=A0A8H5HEG2_9AGAR|nr:hypothetical protein D9615_005444 [Tricholomella constricta]